MRTLILVILLMVIFLIGWFFLQDYLNVQASDFESKLSFISKAIEENKWDLVYIEFSKLKANWQKIRKVLSILLDHHEIDNIDFSMAKTQEYIKTKNIPLSLGEIEVLKTLFNIVKQSESLDLSNIF